MVQVEKKQKIDRQKQKNMVQVENQDYFISLRIHGTGIFTYMNG